MAPTSKAARRAANKSIHGGESGPGVDDGERLCLKSPTKRRATAAAGISKAAKDQGQKSADGWPPHQTDSFMKAARNVDAESEANPACCATLGIMSSMPT